MTVRTPFALTALLGAAIWVLPQVSAPAARSQDADGDGIRRVYYKDSRAELALARVRGDSAVSIVIAAMPGRVAEAEREAGRLGGSVRARNDEVDYLRVSIAPDAAEELIRSPAVQAADIDVYGFWDRPALQSGIAEPPRGAAPAQRATAIADTTRPPWPPTLDDHPLRYPYSALPDLDAQRFLAENPTFDGRGVTIAVLDGFPDLLLPELQTARALDGRPLPKIADVIDAGDPREAATAHWVDASAAHWVDMSAVVTASDHAFTHDGRTFTVPEEQGTFRFGFFDESRFRTGGLGGDVNRDGNPEGSSRLFGVLWDERSNLVWVDTNQDGDFRDERAMTDYRVNHDVGIFGTQDPKAAVRTTVGFTIQTAPDFGFVAINPGTHAHGTVVAGAALASAGEDGRVNGIAPGARLVAINYSYRASGMIEALTTAFEHPDVDIVVLQPNMAIAFPYDLRDGRFTVSIVLDRLIERYDKPFIVPGDNQSGLGSATEHGVSDRVMSVGAYQSRDNYFAHTGVLPMEVDNLHSVSAFGPGGNGALMPDLLAPPSIPSLFPAILPGERRAGLYQLDAGYVICGGTSCAAPVAAGAVALLISAARQSGVPYDAGRLRYALFSSTRSLPNLPAHQQGRGLLQVEAAWRILQVLGEDGVPVVIETDAPVVTVVSQWLERPHRGVGLYEREGWQAGDQRNRVVTLRRTSGPSGPMRFNVRWVGATETFSSARTVVLPLGRQVELPVTVAPATPGAHSALLVLEHPDVPGRAHQMLAVVVAAHRLDESHGYRFEERRELYRPGFHSFFFHVPAGAPAVEVAVQPARGARVGLRRPDGRFVMSGADEAGEGRRPRVLRDPMPGVWEVELVVSASNDDSFDSSGDPRAPLTPEPGSVTATLLRVDVDDAGFSWDGTAAGTTTTGEARFTNRGAAIMAGGGHLPLGSAAHGAATLAAREQRVFTLEVPEGSTELIAEVRSVSDRDADLDLYLFDCSMSCAPAGAGTGTGPQERVTVSDPSPGTWKIVVDAARVPAGSTTFEYVDIVLNPRFGSVTVADAQAMREAGASWSAPANLWVADLPPDGRVPYVIVPVSSSAGALRAAGSAALAGTR